MDNLKIRVSNLEGSGLQPGVRPNRVFLVDDHPIILRALQLLVGRDQGFAVCGEATTGREALDAILRLQPDVAIVDLSLADSSGLNLIGQIRAQSREIKILVYSSHEEPIYAERALRAGANGFVNKAEGLDRVIEALRTVVRDKCYLGQRTKEYLFEAFARSGSKEVQSVESLTNRELEVMELLGRGIGSRQVAEQLSLSVKTIESHRENIKMKLGLRNASELLAYAYRWASGEAERTSRGQ